MEAYGIQGTPTLLMFDRQGRLRRHYLGAVDDVRLGAEIMALCIEDRTRRARCRWASSAGSPRRCVDPSSTIITTIEGECCGGHMTMITAHDHAHGQDHDHEHGGSDCGHGHEHARVPAKVLSAAGPRAGRRLLCRPGELAARCLPRACPEDPAYAGISNAEEYRVPKSYGIPPRVGPTPAAFYRLQSRRPRVARWSRVQVDLGLRIASRWTPTSRAGNRMREPAMVERVSERRRRADEAHACAGRRARPPKRPRRTSTRRPSRSSTTSTARCRRGPCRNTRSCRRSARTPRRSGPRPTARARAQGADALITYMHLMYKKAKARGVRIDRDDLVAPGPRRGAVRRRRGMVRRHRRLREARAETHGVTLRHYLVSSGLTEIIEGTRIFRASTTCLRRNTGSTPTTCPTPSASSPTPARRSTCSASTRASRTWAMASTSTCPRPSARSRSPT